MGAVNDEGRRGDLLQLSEQLAAVGLGEPVGDPGFQRSSLR
jgi:hypothetical protein